MTSNARGVFRTSRDHDEGHASLLMPIRDHSMRGTHSAAGIASHTPRPLTELDADLMHLDGCPLARPFHRLSDCYADQAVPSMGAL